MSTTLYRSFVPELEVRAAANGGDGRTVEGIAVPFNRAQRIYDGLTEQFAQGAFNHQASAAHRVKFARDHMMLGGQLIGRALELRDDAAGLWVALRVSATVAGDETLELIRDGALDELSVGFRERKNRTLADGTVERVKADLFEVAAVAQGAYGQGAKIKAVRADAEDDDGIAVEHEVSIPEQRSDERARNAAARRVLAELLDATSRVNRATDQLIY